MALDLADRVRRVCWTYSKVKLSILYRGKYTYLTDNRLRL